MVLRTAFASMLGTPVSLHPLLYVPLPLNTHTDSLRLHVLYCMLTRTARTRRFDCVRVCAKMHVHFAFGCACAVRVRVYASLNEYAHVLYKLGYVDTRACMHVYIIHAYKTYMQACIYACILTCMKCTHSYINTYTRAHSYIHTVAYIHTYIQSKCTHSYINTYRAHVHMTCAWRLSQDRKVLYVSVCLLM